MHCDVHYLFQSAGAWNFPTSARRFPAARTAAITTTLTSHVCLQGTAALVSGPLAPEARQQKTSADGPKSSRRQRLKAQAAPRAVLTATRDPERCAAGWKSFGKRRSRDLDSRRASGAAVRVAAHRYGGLSAPPPKSYGG